MIYFNLAYRLGDIMDNGYVLLIEKEEMWAKMLAEVLSDNDIPCVMRSVYGAGLVIRAGMQERIKVYVPSECIESATEFVNELFSSDYDE